MRHNDFPLATLRGLSRRRWSPPPAAGGVRPQPPRPEESRRPSYSIPALLALALVAVLALCGLGVGRHRKVLYSLSEAARPAPPRPWGLLLLAWSRGHRGGRFPGLPPAGFTHLAYAWERECRSYSVVWAAYRERALPAPLRGRRHAALTPVKRGRKASALAVLWAKCPLFNKRVGSRYAPPHVHSSFFQGSGKLAVAPRSSWEALDDLGLSVGRVPSQDVQEWLAIKRRRALRLNT